MVELFPACHLHVAWCERVLLDFICMPALRGSEFKADEKYLLPPSVPVLGMVLRALYAPVKHSH